MSIVILYEQGCEDINFETFLIKPFFLHDQNVKTKI